MIGAPWVEREASVAAHVLRHLRRFQTKGQTLEQGAGCLLHNEEMGVKCQEKFMEFIKKFQTLTV